MRTRYTSGAFPPLGRLVESLWRIDPLSVSFTREDDEGNAFFTSPLGPTPMHLRAQRITRFYHAPHPLPATCVYLLVGRAKTAPGSASRAW
ncbi:hypothetical protein BCAR13_1170014 [Paraburkholderia caribensis]|nr:hypothetical protein BCAR13_1170014 [Paraburkholderia caribensis]